MSTSSLVIGSDILGKHTIPELRNLVGVLQDDCKNKKNELQLMVGSKYHDFIDSADLVASMHLKSSLISRRFEEFIDLNQAVSQKMHQLLALTASKDRDQTSPALNTSSANVIPDKTAVMELFNGVSSSSIWNSLSNCDVLDAARVLLIGQLIHRAVKSTTPSQLLFVGHFSNECVDAVAQLLNGMPASGKTQLLSDVQSTDYLASTVREDARLILLQESTLTLSGSGGVGISVPDKANALVALSVLRGKEGIDVEMEEYLQAASTRLHDIMDSVAGSHSVQSLDSASKDLDDPDQSASLSSAEVDINSLSSSVTFIVRALQEIIVDVYWLFFKPESDHADNGQNHSANSATKSPSKLRGLVNLTHYQLMKPILDPIARVAKNARFDYSDLLPDVAAYLLTEQLQKSRPPPTAPSSTELGRHKRFLAWFKSVLVTLTDRTNAILSAIQSATEVAQLQQRIWHSCKFITDETYPSSGSKPTAIDNAGDYSQLMWEQSCQFLFSDGTEQSNSCSLWSIAFRVSFMNQVERLLKTSCQEVLGRTKNMLVRTLAGEGLHVDASMVVSVDASAVRLRGSTPTSSATVYVLADRIQHEFEDNISKLLEEIITPMQSSDGGDMHSSLALTQALRVQCAHLIGQLVVSLRLAAESARDALIAQGHLRSNPTPKKSAIVTDNLRELLKSFCGSRQISSVNRSSVPGSEYALLSGLLIVGRVAWLFRVRGGFLEYALELQNTYNVTDERSGKVRTAGGLGQDKNSSSVGSATDLSSEDQFRSAFEIADTNGDGVVTYSEALEAIQALAVGDNAIGESPDLSTLALAVGLSSKLTPTLTYPEFVLICGSQMLASECYKPLMRAQLILDSIIGLVHVCWSVSTVQKCCSDLPEAIGSELCFDQLNLQGGTSSHEDMGKKRHFEKLFKLSWQTRWVDLTGGADDSENNAFLADSSAEKILIPSALTAAVGRVFGALNNQISVSVVSVDTMQRLDVQSAEERKDEQDRLGLDDVDNAEADKSPLVVMFEGGVCHSRSRTHSLTLSEICLSLTMMLALDQVHVAYSTYLSQIKASHYQAAAANILEEAALQVLFDLSVCQALALQTSRYGNLTHEQAMALLPYRPFMSQWRNYLDPITAELLLPLIEESMASFVHSGSLLLPCLYGGADSSPQIRQQLKKKTATDKVDPQKQKGPSSTEALLQAVFPQQQNRSSAASTTTSTIRFALLPLAISTLSSSAGTNLAASASNLVRPALAVSLDKPGGVAGKGTNSKVDGAKQQASSALKWW